MHLINKELYNSVNVLSNIAKAHDFPENMGIRDIHLWQIDTKQFVNKLPKYYVELSQDEKKRADKFYFVKDKINFILAHAFLRGLLGKYIGVETESIQFYFNRYGKPLVSTDEGEGVCFNLSHSGSMIFIALSPLYHIGVDVEQVKENKSFLSLSSSYFTKAEHSAICELPEKEQLPAFFRCWTRKEAYIKGQGKGLSLALDSFEVNVQNSKKELLLNTCHDPLALDRWSLLDIKISDEYVAALAVENHSCQVHRFELTAQNAIEYFFG